MCDFFFVFVTFPCGVLGQVWYLIELIPDLCLLTYFKAFVLSVFEWPLKTGFTVFNILNEYIVSFYCCIFFRFAVTYIGYLHLTKQFSPFI